jgi:hypothetical protein
MAEEEHRFRGGLAGEIYLQVIAKILGAVKFGMASQGFKPPGQQRSQAIDGLFVVTRGFDFNQLPNGFCDRLLSLFEVAEPTGRFGASGVGDFLLSIPSHG